MLQRVLRPSCRALASAWRAAAGEPSGRGGTHGSALQLLARRSLTVDVEQARQRAQDATQRLRGDAGGEGQSAGGSGAVDVFDRVVKTQQVRPHAAAAGCAACAAWRRSDGVCATLKSCRRVHISASANAPPGYRGATIRCTRRWRSACWSGWRISSASSPRCLCLVVHTAPSRGA
jgi:hypothetical protein